MQRYAILMDSVISLYYISFSIFTDKPLISHILVDERGVFWDQ